MQITFNTNEIKKDRLSQIVITELAKEFSDKKEAVSNKLVNNTNLYDTLVNTLSNMLNVDTYNYFYNKFEPIFDILENSENNKNIEVELIKVVNDITNDNKLEELEKSLNLANIKIKELESEKDQLFTELQRVRTINNDDIKDNFDDIIEYLNDYIYRKYGDDGIVYNFADNIMLPLLEKFKSIEELENKTIYSKDNKKDIENKISLLEQDIDKIILETKNNTKIIELEEEVKHLKTAISHKDKFIEDMNKELKEDNKDIIELEEDNSKTIELSSVASAKIEDNKITELSDNDKFKIYKKYKEDLKAYLGVKRISTNKARVELEKISKSYNEKEIESFFNKNSSIENNNENINLDEELLKYEDIQNMLNNDNTEIVLFNKIYKKYAEEFKDKNPNKKATKKAVSLYIIENLEKHYPNAYKLIVDTKGYSFNGVKSTDYLYNVAEDIYDTIANVINKQIKLNNQNSLKDKVLKELDDLYHDDIEFDELTIDIDDVKKIEANLNDDESKDIFDNYYKLYEEYRLYHALKPEIKSKLVNLDENIDNKTLIQTIYKEFINDDIRQDVIRLMQDLKIDNIININSNSDFDEFQSIIIDNMEDNNNTCLSSNVDLHLAKSDLNIELINKFKSNPNKYNDRFYSAIILKLGLKDIYNKIITEEFNLKTNTPCEILERVLSIYLDTIDFNEDNSNFDELVDKITLLKNDMKAQVRKDSKIDIVKEHFTRLNEPQQKAMIKAFNIDGIDDYQFDNWDFARFIDICKILIDSNKLDDDIIIDDDF